LLLIRAHLDERAWRLLLGAEAKVLGRGGIKVVAAAVQAHPDTVAQGVRELGYPDPIPGRVRRPGGGETFSGGHRPDVVGGVGRVGGPGDPRRSGVGARGGRLNRRRNSPVNSSPPVIRRRRRR